MANENTQQLTEAMDKTILTPMRSYMRAVLDHAETVTSIQVEAARNYSEVAFKELRTALDVRDAEGLRAYVSHQPEMAKEFSERVKSDAEKLTQANQAFMENAQKATQESVSKIQKTAEEGVERVQKAAATS